MKALISLLQFTTILPLGKARDFENFARHSYIYPVLVMSLEGLSPFRFFSLQTGLLLLLLP